MKNNIFVLLLFLTAAISFVAGRQGWFDAPKGMILPLSTAPRYTITAVPSLTNAAPSTLYVFDTNTGRTWKYGYEFVRGQANSVLCWTEISPEWAATAK